MAKGTEIWGWGQEQKQGHRREPASSFPIDMTLDLVLASGPDLQTEVGKEQEEEDNFVPTSCVKGPAGRNFLKDKLCLCCCPPSVSVFLPHFRSPSATCTASSFTLLVAPQCGSPIPTVPVPASTPPTGFHLWVSEGSLGKLQACG